MSHTNGTQADTTEERKPPTLADIVREKTDDGRRIIDFFLDVMEARVEGAELCHRIDAARQLVKYGSEDAARFLTRYRGVPCGHSTRGRRDPADPCSDAEAAGRENAPGPFTDDLLTVLSAVDEDLMARLVRAQTADGFTIVEFLDDVMQDRNEGFKCHHRIAAAKELIVHIVRDEQPDTNTTVIPATAGTHPLNPEPVERVEGAGPDDPAPTTVIPAAGSIVIPAPTTVIPAKEPAPEQSGAGTHPLNPEANSTAVPEANSTVVPAAGSTVVPADNSIVIPADNSIVIPADNSIVIPADNSIVIPAKAGTHPLNPEPVERVEGPSSVRPEPVEGAGPDDPANSTVIPAKEPAPEQSQAATQDSTVRQTRRRRTRKQRRQEGAARAAMRGKHPNSERNNKEKQDKPAPVELTPAERRIKERLEQHWHEPDPWPGPIDSTSPSRSPPG